MNSIQTYISEKLRLDSNTTFREHFVPQSYHELEIYADEQLHKSKNTLQDPIDLSFIDMSQIINTGDEPSYLFDSNTEIKYVNASNWKFTCDARANFTHIFSDCTELKYIDVSDWEFNAPELNLCGLFGGCTALETINGIDKWNMPNMIITTGMFRSCERITSLDLSKWDMSQVVRCRSMFTDCTNLKEIDLTGLNLSNVEKCGKMFCRCKNLKKIKGIENIKLTNCTNIDAMFLDCAKLCFNAENLLPATHEGSLTFSGSKIKYPSWYKEAD